jgi:hypothetical protein
MATLFPDDPLQYRPLLMGGLHRPALDDSANQPARDLTMLFLHGKQPSFCDRIPRRSFLAIGGLTCAGLSLADVLRAEQAAGLSNPTGSPRHKGLIMVYMPGGPPHQDMYDLKPDAPLEIRGEFQPIATSVPGIQIGELLPKLAADMERFTIIRSLVGSDGAHASALCATGRPYGSSVPGGWPIFSSAVSAVAGPTRSDVPAAADLSERMQHNPYNIGGPGFLGTNHAPFRPDGEVMQDMVVGQDMLDRLHDRKGLLTAFDRLRRGIDAGRDGTAIGKELDTCTQQALDMLTGSALAEALDLEREDPAIRARYGTDDPNVLPYSPAGYKAIMSRFLLARRLIEAGVRCVTVSFADFDWHGSNFVFARKVLPLFDQGITALVADLHERGLSDDVSVVAWGEFGRTPRINKDAGRDHWPQVSCALLAGGGMRTGQVIGSTNRLAESAADRPVHYAEVLATLYHRLGLNPGATTVNDLNGRPRYLIEGHGPIAELG